MMGLGEMVVMMGAAAMMIGPKGMPNMARQAGRALGTAARMLKEGRAAISTFSEENQLAEVGATLLSPPPSYRLTDC